jgi:hypothetical protein
VDAQQETIKLVNRTIREFADDPRIQEDAEWEFFCECGCFTLVLMTIAQYDAAMDVLAHGHAFLPRPDAKRGEVDALDRLLELTADPGGEEVLRDAVGEDDPRHRVARERQVERGVRLGPGEARES